MILRNIFLLILFTIPASIFAKHIIGGEMTYQCKSLNAGSNEVTFTVSLTLFRDADETAFDDDAEIGIFKGSTGDWSYYTTQVTGLPVKSPVDTESGTPCLSSVPVFNIEKGVYTFDVTFPISSTESYLLTYTRCCRVNDITNIINSGDEGATYYIEITPEAQKTCDSSPKFEVLPPTVICANQNIDFDFEISDADGDRVEYELCAPSAGGGVVGSTENGGGDPRSCNGIIPDPQRCGPQLRPLDFKSGYSFDRPLRGDPVVTIDRNTGKMTGYPEVQGVFAIAVCATSYRGSEQLTTIKRDFQLNVTECKKEVIASVKDQILLDKVFDIRTCTGKNILLKNGKLSNPKFVDNYTWEIFLNTGGKLQRTTEDAVFTVPDYDTYDGKLVINRDSPYENCRDSVDFNLVVNPPVKAGLKLDYDTCFHSPINFIDDSEASFSTITDYEWKVNSDVIATTKNARELLTTPGRKLVRHKVVDDNLCEDSTSVVIEYYPAPNEVKYNFGAGQFCIPATFQFTPDMDIVDDSYNLVWDLGSYGTYEEYSPIVKFEDEGTLTVQLKVTSKLGCIANSLPKDYELLPSPVADFSYTPTYLDQFNKDIQLTDESQDADSYEWYIGDAGLFYDQNPSATFIDTGYQEIKQIVIHTNGCTDTLTQLVDVTPRTTFYMPNAFTPNADGNNDIFKGKGFTENMTAFRMVLFNRWGEKIYETTDVNAGWDGNLPNGKSAPSETFVYKVDYVGARGQKQELRGSFLLLR